MGAKQQGVCQPGSTGAVPCSALPCPAVPSLAPLTRCPALGKLWVSTELVWCCGLCSQELRAGLSSLCSCCRCPQPHLARAKAWGCLGGSKQGFPPQCGSPGIGVPSGTVQGYIKHISLPDLAPPNVPSCPMGINWPISTKLCDRAFLCSSSRPSPCLLLVFCLKRLLFSDLLCLRPKGTGFLRLVDLGQSMQVLSTPEAKSGLPPPSQPPLSPPQQVWHG